MEKDNNILEDIDNINDSLHEHYSFKADPGQSSIRVDKFLMSRIENITRNKIQQAAKAGNIFVSDRIVKSNYKIKLMKPLKNKKISTARFVKFFYSNKIILLQILCL